MSQGSSKGQFSRPLIVATVPEEGMSIEIVADETERAALAAENDVISIDRLAARLEVRPASRGAFIVRGALDALATRNCVVTLEPFVETVTEEIDVRFAAEGRSEEFGEDEVPEDQIVGGKVDLGAVASEFFALGLDPYPRKPGASFDQAGEGDADSGSPFSALRELKSRPGEPD